VAAGGGRGAGQPAEPPDDGGQDEDRQPDRGPVLEDDAPDGRKGDGRAGPGQLGPFAGQPRGTVLGIVGCRGAGGRFQRTVTADSTASTAAARPMAAMANARIWGRRERASGSPWRSARWPAFHSV
jgi:hypothetical protein